ncbi:hypothetical protein MIND_00643900 [Mycena indigotica]|uniref:Uncharacterized protein n=1 Tax=Mycena indigotica TaxID=2126181 RepID=A0A8H6SQT3_9AGAR|nr:uncharacterized protein MIND_00643900 [Mycena indigotica]KAF7304123.1 hypothetical protein MIND_00643900 [Mycena indigotica]
MPASLDTLPTEILLEITHHLPQSLRYASFFSPMLRYEHTAPARKLRTQTLCALRLTCMRLAGALFGALYESLDVSSLDFERVEEAIEDEDEVVERVLPAVKSVHVSMRTWMANTASEHVVSPFSTAPIIAFLTFLHSLPSLTRLELGDIPLAFFPVFTYAFAVPDRALPNVTALCVTDSLLHAPGLPTAFPNAKILASPTMWARERSHVGLGWVQTVKEMKGLTALAGFRLGEEAVEVLVTSVPSLTRLAISGGVRRYMKPFLLALRALPLTHLSLVYESPDPAQDPPALAPMPGSAGVPPGATEEDIVFVSMEELVALGTEVLLGHNVTAGGKEKVLEVWSYDLLRGFEAHVEHGPRVVRVGAGM